MPASRAPIVNGERLLHRLRHLLAAIRHPGDVVIDRVGLIELRPQVQQHQVAAPDRGAARLRRRNSASPRRSRCSRRWGGWSVVRPRSLNRRMTNCCTPYSSRGWPARVACLMKSNASARMRSTRRPASRCISNWAGVHFASKIWINSAELTTSTPRPRISSTVPASTLAT